MYGGAHAIVQVSEQQDSGLGVDDIHLSHGHERKLSIVQRAAL